MTANQAIEQSIERNEIVHMDYDATAAETLMVECDDHTTSNDEEEYWGENEAGETWRVHMALAR